MRRGGHFVILNRIAAEIAPHMQPENNRSPSFQVFVQGLQALLATSK
jgi:hypothetical protein